MPRGVKSGHRNEKRTINRGREGNYHSFITNKASAEITRTFSCTWTTLTSSVFSADSSPVCPRFSFRTSWYYQIYFQGSTLPNDGFVLLAATLGDSLTVLSSKQQHPENHNDQGRDTHLDDILPYAVLGFLLRDWGQRDHSHQGRLTSPQDPCMFTLGTCLLLAGFEPLSPAPWENLSLLIPLRVWFVFLWSEGIGYSQKPKIESAGEET